MEFMKVFVFGNTMYYKRLHYFLYISSPLFIFVLYLQFTNTLYRSNPPPHDIAVLKVKIKPSFTAIHFFAD